jgi:uncharacterized protein (DUF2141 family)
MRLRSTARRTALPAIALALVVATAIDSTPLDARGQAPSPTPTPSPTAAATPTPRPGERPHVLAIVRGLRNDRGRVRGAIYPSRETFTHEGQGTATCTALVNGGVSRCRFYGVPAGRYAIGVMHDEDDDDHFDQGFLGIPEEGYGFSRDARGTMSAPSFESAAFVYDGRSVMRQEMTIHYGI